ncbi:hypothetical protein C8R45DRAFT_80727 [Mycena sanguinolenta]|nr:hypothetical protein C8R45DRAFT_80727 [Mycena sanguinolenta]
MRLSSCGLLALRVVIVGLISILSLVGALPILPNSDPRARPSSLLGRSYTRRVTDPSFVALDAPVPRLENSHSPLARAARFQIAQHRSTSTSRSLGVADKNPDAQRPSVVERPEILLSHEQMVPPPVPTVTATPLPSSTNPATTTLISIPPAPAKSTAPSSESHAVAHKSKSKPKKTTMKPLKHDNPTPHVIYSSTE